MDETICGEIELVENVLQAEDFVRLRIEAGFVEIPVEHARKALRNGLVNVSALYRGELVGMGRLVGDGAMYWYLQEIIVLPRFRQKGIGTMIVGHLVDYAKAHSVTGKFTTIGGVSATGAGEIITGSLVNAKAVAEYIFERQPEIVSLVCMGNGGVRPAAEDVLCAAYIKSILEGTDFIDLQDRVNGLRDNGGQHFFDRSRQDVFPEEDFWLCTRYDQFPFVIQIGRDRYGYITNRIYAS